MNEISLSAIGQDRPGIVAAITGVLSDLGCSIEDSTMAVLQGQFAVVLVLSAPELLTGAVIEDSLGDVGTEFGLVIVARELRSGEPVPAYSPAGRSAWSISVHGADRPGIVHGVSQVLAEHGANIVELRTHVVGDADNPLYMMAMEILVAHGDADALSSRLASTGADLGVAVTMIASEDDIL